VRHNWKPKSGPGSCTRCELAREPALEGATRKWIYSPAGENGECPSCVERETDVRVYKFGAQPPHQGEELARDQIWLAHQYRNKLVEIYRDWRKQRDELRQKHCPDLVAAEEELGRVPSDEEPEGTGLKGRKAVLERAEKLERQRRGDRSRRRPRNGRRGPRSEVRSPSEESKRALKEVRAQIRCLREQIKAIKERLKDNEPYMLGMRRASERRSERIREARGESGLRHGTYISTERAADQSNKTSIDPPGFVSWHHRGPDRIGTQLQGHVTWDDLVNGRNNQARLYLSPRPGAQPGSKRARTRLQGEFWLRVGSEGRSPVWAKWRCVVHRQPPPETRCTWAYVTRSNAGGFRDRWSVQITLDGDLAPKDFAPTGTVAVDVGWRRLDDRLRVAVWVGSDGKEGELALGIRWLEQIRKVDDIKSYRSMALDDLREDVVGYLRESGGECLSALRKVCYRKPSDESLDKCLSVISRWRTPKRFAHLAREIPPGVLQDFLRAWLSRDRHLWDYEWNLRDQLIAQRLDLYRRFASYLSRNYHTVVTEDLNLSKLKRVPPLWVQQNGLTDSYRAYMTDAAPGELLESIRGRCANSVKVDPKQTTMRCCLCGELSKEPEPQQLVHACRACGRAWDQDRNAAHNLLARGGVELKSTGPLAPFDVWTSDAEGPNRAERRTALRDRSHAVDYPRLVARAAR
jgi:transposase